MPVLPSPPISALNTNPIQVFDFEDQPVRTTIGEDGEMWWVTPDPCRCLRSRIEAQPPEAWRSVPH
jgi:prophage antirepressor-like protein